jgi:selenocysteine-specific elongation factor
VVAAFCATDPLAPGMPTEAARASLRLPSRDLVTALVSGDIVQDGGSLRMFTRHAGDVGPAPPPDMTAKSDRSVQVSHGASVGAPGGAAGRLPATVAAAVQTVLDDLAREPFAAPDTERLRALGLDAKALATAARAGLLLRVADLVVLAPDAAEQAAAALAELDQPFTTSQARQALRTSRRVAIPLLEYLDRARITERLPGDLRRIRNLQNVYSVTLSTGMSSEVPLWCQRGFRLVGLAESLGVVEPCPPSSWSPRSPRAPRRVVRQVVHALQPP